MDKRKMVRRTSTIVAAIAAVMLMIIAMSSITMAPVAEASARRSSPPPNDVIITEWPLTDGPAGSGAAAASRHATTSQATAAVAEARDGSSEKPPTLSNPVMAKLRDYQLVRPQLSGGNDAIVEQLAPGDHPQTLSYRIQAFDKNFDLILNKNNELFSSEYQQLRLAYDSNDATKEPRIERTQVVHCYYHGHVTGDPSSRVTMSTCNGLRGSIQAHGEYFAVEPASFAEALPTTSTGFSAQSSSSSSSSAPIGFSPSSYPLRNGHPLHDAFPLSRIPNTDHLIYRHADLQEEVKTCGLQSDTPSSPRGGSSGSSYTTSPIDGAAGRSAPLATTPSADDTAHLVAGVDGAGSAPYGERETIELLIFNDNERWRNKGESTEANTLAILNEMKEFYKDTQFNHPVNVVLVGQVTFSQGDPYTADMTDSGVAVEGERGLLQVFHRYRNLAQSVLPRHDNGQLFSERRFTSNIMGLAGVGSMCSEQSGSITCMTSDSITKNAMISAHETGHTLSMMHDGVYNTCPSGGYIMQTTTGTATTFSHCSIDSANTFLSASQSSCLYNYAARRSPIKRSDTSWLSGEWSACSVTCGLGTQVRSVDCRDSTGNVLKVTDCNEFTTPLSVRICNATALCDPCASRNCSGVGICRDGTCMCSAGRTGRQCEINVAVTASTKDQRSSSSSTLEEDQKETSKMALVLTAGLTGGALACATLLWLCRTIRRHVKERSMRVKMLASSLSSSAELQAAAPPNDGINSSRDGDDGATSSGGTDGEMKASATSEEDIPSAAITPSLPIAAPTTGLHKTPRSTPRSIAVKA